MKRCTTCHRPLNRGATSAHTGAATCLVCQVAQVMKTFVWPPRRASK
jgi:recombinational DNA repair protein (RecF pathway)